MKCIRCGRPVYNGNSRVIIRQGKQLREHRNCALAKDSPVPVRKQAPVPAVRQAPAPRVATREPAVKLNAAYRYFIRPAMRDKLDKVGDYGHFLTPVTVEIYSLPAEMVEERPDMADGLTEIVIKS